MTSAKIGSPFPPSNDAMFGPIVTAPTDRPFIVAQLGQSLDGRIATISGDSRWINGPAALDHLHRLRSHVDAVVVGIGTIIADDPQLTVRCVSGPQPVGIIIDPRPPSGFRSLPRNGRHALSCGHKQRAAFTPRRRIIGREGIGPAHCTEGHRGSTI
jgi:diaminohydroxyphosphoribosylaminopyrimidine deaminase / 5-amino-6-(5-phosphoribosylamino)uracil reductase